MRASILFSGLLPVRVFQAWPHMHRLDLPQYGSPAAAALSPCKQIANP